eukprot:853677-Prymnesium_polylepis.1
MSRELSLIRRESVCTVPMKNRCEYVSNARRGHFTSPHYHVPRHRLLEELEQLARVALRRVRLVGAHLLALQENLGVRNLHLADVGGALDAVVDHNIAPATGSGIVKRSLILRRISIAGDAAISSTSAD